MSTYYRTREGQLTATDTRTNLSSNYGQSVTSAMQPPPSTTKIGIIMVSFANNGASNGASCIQCILSGDGLTAGTQTFSVGSITVDGTPATARNYGPIMIPVDLAVIAGGDISIQAAMQGTDTGSVEVSVTLGFQ